MKEEYAIYKIQLTEAEAKTLKDITEYAVRQKRTYLTCLVRSEYGLDEAEIKKTAADLLRFETFLNTLNDIPF